MKNFKDITISIFAIIGFVAVLSSFTNQSQDPHTTAESHVWEIYGSVGGQNINNYAYMYNKVTGEVRKLSTSTIFFKKDGTVEDSKDTKYALMSEAK